MKKFVILFSILALFATTTGLAMADFVPQATPQQNAVATEVACDGSVVTPTNNTTCGNTLYNQALKDLGVGTDGCYFDGQYTVNTLSCKGLPPPPITDCSGVFQGGLLSPVETSVEFNGFATIYAFRSDAGGCGSVWGGFHIDNASFHFIEDLSISSSTESVGIYPGTPARTVGQNDWTSTDMLPYIPGVTYSVIGHVDGQIFRASFTIPQ